MPLPGMLIHQPWLVASVLPATVVLDLGRSHGVAALTKRIESMAERIRGAREQQGRTARRQARGTDSQWWNERVRGTEVERDR